ncbi:MAG: DUF6279 family lipoprotein [Nitrospiraceae bacterium]
MVLLSSCMPTLAYRYADWLVLWKIDTYVDLTGDQKSFLHGRLKELLAHHRKDALPNYEQFLGRIKAGSADGLSREEVEWIVTRYQQLRVDLLERMVLDGATLLASLNDKQLQHLEQTFHSESEKIWKDDTEKRLSKRATDLVNVARNGLGSLTAEQKRTIVELSRALPDMQRVEFQQQRQQSLVQLLRMHPSEQVLVQRLREWFIYPELSATEEYRNAFQESTTAVAHMIWSIDKTVTPQQRVHALAELQHLIDDIHALAKS